MNGKRHQMEQIPRNSAEPPSSKQDFIPRHPRRGDSSDSMTIQTIAAILNSSGRVSELSSSSSSLHSLYSLSSFTSPDSSDTASLSPVRKRSTSPEWFHAPHPTTIQHGTLNRWDSWGERTPRDSPKKPKRREIVETPESIQVPTPPRTPQGGKLRRRIFTEETSRWSSHSECSRAPSVSPRRTCSSSRETKASTVQQQQQQQQEEILDTQSGVPRFLEKYLPSENVRPRKARNLLLLPEVSPNRPPMKNLPRREASKSRLIDIHSRHTIDTIEFETIRKVKAGFSSEDFLKRSFLTSSTCESGASSTMSHDFSIPSCSSDER